LFAERFSPLFVRYPEGYYEPQKNNIHIKGIDPPGAIQGEVFMYCIDKINREGK
jgi:hypothetical protein